MPDPAARPEWERRFFSAIKPVFDDARPAIQRGPLSFSWPTFRAQIAAAAKDQYTETFIAAYLILFFDEGMRRGLELPDMQPEDLDQIGAQYGRTMSGRLADEIVDKTKASVGAAVNQETGAITDVEKFDNAFTDNRVEKIAVTETTRSISEGEQSAREEMQRTGNREIVARWVTERDNRVCKICAPLDRKLERVWVDRFPSGPPAHPNCRCTLFFEVR